MEMIQCDKCKETIRDGNFITISACDKGDFWSGTLRKDKHLCADCFKSMGDWFNYYNKPIVVEELSEENSGILNVCVYNQYSTVQKLSVELKMTAREWYKLKDSDEWKALLKRLEDI